MEIVNVEAGMFEQLLETIEEAAGQVELLCSRYADKALSAWLDNQDVCLLFQISPRTLQSMRDSGTLAYTQVNRKMYYKPEDVQKLLPVVEQKRKESYFKQKKEMVS
ncbi:MAG: helix-turn-helix domain-containing protein [Bacteroides sp.]|nr:helix-turn-helix domain-containing protein [Bacteroides sp.]